MQCKAWVQESSEVAIQVMASISHCPPPQCKKWVVSSVNQYTVILEKQVGLLNGRASNMHNGFYVASYEPLHYGTCWLQAIMGPIRCMWEILACPTGFAQIPHRHLTEHNGPDYACFIIRLQQGGLFELPLWLFCQAVVHQCQFCFCSLAVSCVQLSSLRQRTADLGTLTRV
jgi:hypothetical protein